MNGEIVLLPRAELESHSEYAYRVLRENIMQFHMEPGFTIDESAFAKMLDVSRTPIHEAVNKLREERLVDVVPRKESKVSKIEMSMVNEALFIRCCIDPEVVRLAAGNIQPKYVEKLLHNLNQQKQILDEGTELYRFYPVDDAFHRLIYEATNKTRTHDLLKHIVTQLDRVRYLVRFDGSWNIEAISYAEHRALFGYMVYQADLDVDVETYMKRHVMRFQNSMEILLDKYADYFSFT
ncbi:MAG: GntR family transcriptional regulator [Oscillospiraceae bacterium]|nr:GntR family transcriptional regulator [Oscillospiraceae bacterium]